MSNLFEAKRLVEQYFDSIKPRTTVHGFTRYIATNGKECVIVPHPNSASGELVFRCEIRNGNNYIELV